MSAARSIATQTFSVLDQELSFAPTDNRRVQRDAQVSVQVETVAPRTINNVLVHRLKPGTATHDTFVVWGGFDSKVGINNARMLSKDILRNKISKIAEQIAEGNYEVDRSLAEEITMTLNDAIDLLPPQLNFPYPVLLDEGVSLCWDEGDTYAELALDFSGNVGVYAKNPGFAELFIDMPLSEYRRKGELIPSGLREILT